MLLLSCGGNKTSPMTTPVPIEAKARLRFTGSGDLIAQTRYATKIEEIANERTLKTQSPRTMSITFIVFNLKHIQK